MKIIVISAKDELRDSMAEVLSDIRDLLGADEIALSDSGISADPAKYEILAAASPFSDGFGLDAAVRFTENGGAGAVFLTSAANAEKAAVRVPGYPVMILPRPFNAFIFREAVRCICVNHTRSHAITEENARLEKKLGEIKLVGRAKSALMKYLCISEPEAHRQIQQRAMDQRRTLAETAEDIIRTYEYLN